ncbi:MAG TPA: cupredoxin domain-containing protein [Dehalococcoidia bacterium]|nr:cupredoxin domain-containing protein [Dehalococcoidia bacterium]
MADERRRRRRRRDRRSREGGQSQADGQTASSPQTEAEQSAEAPQRSLQAPRSSSRTSASGRTQTPRRPPQPSPLGFWRRGKTRSARGATGGRRTGGADGMRNPFANMYFPPWAPVVGVMVIVFGILAGIFIFRQTTGDPKVGQHWHARYEVTICGTRQAPIPTFEDPEGVHTHGDGVIHIHPFNADGEGDGARLVKFFEYAGGVLAKNELRMPGETKTYISGQPCAEGQDPAVVQVFLTRDLGEVKLDNFTNFIPHDGDSVRIVYGPPEPARTGVGLVIPPIQATRTVTIVAGDSGQQTESTGFFSPNAINVAAEEIVRINLQNNGAQTHNLRVAGGDGAYETADDFVTIPLLLTSGESGYTVVQFSTPGQYVFRCDIHPQVQTGIINVTGAASPTATATP